MPPDIVLLLCDTARADAFAPWGGPAATPTMDRLVREGTAYRRATSQAPWTLPSTASILSGKLPTEHGINNDCLDWGADRPTSPAAAVKGYRGSWLPEALAERGYQTWGASCNTWISTWGGFDRGFDRFEDVNDQVRLPRGKRGRWIRRARRLHGKLDRGGKTAAEAFGRRLGEATSRPLFAFVNLMEVHSPYDPPRPYFPYAFWKRMETFRLTGGGRGPRRFLVYNLGVERPPAEFVGMVRKLYASCARYEDWVLGRFVRMIEERGRPTLLVVVSDHGENLGDHGMFGHNSSLHETLLHVPMVAWGHRVDVSGGWVEEVVPTISVSDWLVGAADGDAAPAAGNGAVVSEYESTTGWVPADIREQIARRGRGDIPPLVYHAGLAVRDGRTKYVAVDDGTESLYDVEDDPGEERDLASARPEALEPFRRFVEAWRERRAAQPRYRAGEEADEEITQHLRALGYID